MLDRILPILGAKTRAPRTILCHVCANPTMELVDGLPRPGYRAGECVYERTWECTECLALEYTGEIRRGGTRKKHLRQGTRTADRATDAAHGATTPPREE